MMEEEAPITPELRKSKIKTSKLERKGKAIVKSLENPTKMKKLPKN